MRTCVHSVGILCGYMPNSSLLCISLRNLCQKVTSQRTVNTNELCTKALPGSCHSEQSKQLISHSFDPSWNMVVLSGTHICRKIRINSRRSIGGQQDLWQTTTSDRVASSAAVLKKLEWPSLEQRRQNQRFVLMY